MSWAGAVGWGRALAVLAVGILLPQATGWAATGEDATGPGRYGIVVTRDVPITLADGTVLRADVHAPAEPATGRPAAGPFPVIVGLTPYGKRAGEDSGAPGFGGLNPELVTAGYLGVVVDVPGTGGSQGRSQLFGAEEAAAGAQVIEWAARLPRSTGAVGMIGHSYLAIDQLFTAAAVGRDSPLKAIFPMSAATDPYRDLFVSGGAVNMESSLGLIGAYAGSRTLNPVRERPSDPVDAAGLTLGHAAQTLDFEAGTLRDVLLDGPRRFDGPYWRERAPARVLRDIVRNGVAVFLVGGLYDVFQRGAPLNYSGLQNAAAGRPVHAPMVSGQPVSPRYRLLFGPWTHDDLGAGVDLTALQLSWFDHWLKGADTGITDTTAPLRVIEPGGAAYDAASYPVDPRGVTRLHLSSDGALTGRPPAAGSDRLVFTGLSQPCSRSTDQWSAGALSGGLRSAGLPALCTGPAAHPPAPAPAELAYTSAPLAAPLRLGGPLGMTVHASSTRPETLFAVTVEDVAPDGSATVLTGGALLGSQRAVDPVRSWPAPRGGWLLPYQPLTAASARPVPVGRAVRHDIEIRPVFATVPAGHRLRVRLGTGDTPHLAPPPSAARDLVGGVYRIGYGPDAPSWIDLPAVRVS